MNQTIFEMFGPRRRADGVGVEIEVEGRNLPQLVEGWEGHRDGSLQGEALEYVTIGACSLDDLAKRMDKLKAAFDNEGGQVNNDLHRGSIHVHVNVQNRTPKEIFSILTAWLVVEALWLRLCGPTRENNLFCASSASQGDIPEYALRLLQIAHVGDWHRAPLRYKYNALNTNPISNFGSIEFRTFAATIDKADVTRWAGWCYKFVNEFAKNDPENTVQFLKDCLNDPMSFLQKFLDKETLDKLSLEFVYPFIEAGTESASEMLMVWDEFKKFSKKKPDLRNKVVADEAQPKPRNADPLAQWVFRMREEHERILGNNP